MDTTRDKKTGRYVDTKFDKPCTCGHTLGDHTADKAGPIQPCLALDCECECFTKAKRQMKTAAQQICQWFARCTNAATTTTPHPVLGNVPTCDRCHQFATGAK
jgi:hypothetical protein